MGELGLKIDVFPLTSIALGLLFSILGKPGVNHSLSLLSSLMNGVKQNAFPLGYREQWLFSSFDIM